MSLLLALVRPVALLFLLSGCASIAPGRSIAESPGAKPVVYVAMGASDAVGVGAAGPQESWVSDLGRRLPPGSTVTNLGISGEKLRQSVTDELPIAIDANPDLITIWLAVNDFNARIDPTAYEQDLDAMLSSIQARTHAHVAVANIPDLTLVPAYGGIDRGSLGDEVSRWNTAIARQAQAHGATLIDLHSTWRELADHPEFVGADGFHPSAAGYQRLADIFYDALQQQHVV